jgi:hypothetical protein
LAVQTGEKHNLFSLWPLRVENTDME